VLCGAVVIGLSFAHGHSNDVWLELSKAGIQLAVVVGLGAIVSLVVRMFEEARERRRLVDELRLDVFHDLVNSYQSLKAARRNLRAIGLRNWQGGALSAKQVDVLSEWMATLIEVEMAFGRVNRDLDARAHVFSSSANIRDHVLALEEYAHALVEEWEDIGGPIREGSGCKPTQIRKLSAFLGPADKDFTPHAARSIGIVEWTIRAELLDPTSAGRSA
jgi:hypothetical protein